MIEAALYGLGTALIWGTGDFLSRKPSQRIGFYLTSSYVQLLSFIGLIFYASFSASVNLNSAVSQPTFVALNLAAGVFYFFGISFLYRGCSSGVMSIVAPVAGSYPVIAIVLAVFILDQSFSNATFCAIILILAGVVLAGVRISEGGGHDFKLDSTHFGTVKGLDSAILSCLFVGTGDFLVGVVASHFGFIFPTLVLKGAATFTAFFCLIILGQKFLVPRGKDLFWIVVISVLDSVGFILFSLGVISAGGALPVVVTLTGLGGGVTMVWARMIYGERIARIQTLGILMLLFGVSIILYV